MPDQPDPMKTAAELWDHLAHWQPATAAALLRQLRAMPDDWPLRVFRVGRVDAALALPPAAAECGWPDVPPEIPPYLVSDWEDCPACEGRSCRYHQGHDDGYQALYRPMTEALTADKDVTVRALLARLAYEDEVPPVS